VLRLAASLTNGIPVDSRDAFTGMDPANVDRAVRAMLRAAGRPAAIMLASTGAPGTTSTKYSLQR
jgi:hypothetical protein